MGLFDNQSLVVLLILKVFRSFELFQIMGSHFSGDRLSYHRLIIEFIALSVPGFLHIFLDNSLLLFLRALHLLLYLLDRVLSVRWMLFGRWLFMLCAHVKPIEEELMLLTFTILPGHSLPGLFEVFLLIRWLCAPLILRKNHIGFVWKPDGCKHLLVLKLLANFMFQIPFFSIGNLSKLDFGCSDFLLSHLFFFLQIGLMLVNIWHYEFVVFNLFPL